jgi:hypothetical protein
MDEPHTPDPKKVLRDALIAELRDLIPTGATVGGHGPKIRLTFEPLHSYVDVGEAQVYIRWLSAGHIGTFREMMQPEMVMSKEDLLKVNLRMHAALAKIRGLCMLETGKQTKEGQFIPNPFAELIGRLAGEAMTGMKGE